MLNNTLSPQNGIFHRCELWVLDRAINLLGDPRVVTMVCEKRNLLWGMALCLTGSMGVLSGYLTFCLTLGGK